jgi:hypothetical protein
VAVKPENPPEPVEEFHPVALEAEPLKGSVVVLVLVLLT